MAKTALKRQSDVEPTSVINENKSEGRLEFEARAGSSLDLEKVHAAVGETRLSGKGPGRVTGCQFRYLEITAIGEVVKTDKGLLLKVKGTNQVFRLEDEPGPKAVTLEGTTWERLQKAVAKGEKTISVTGRVKGWTGHAPAILKEFPREYQADPTDPEKRVALPLLVTVTGWELPRK